MLRPFCPTYLWIPLALLLALSTTALAARQRSQSLSLESVNDAEWQAQAKPSTALLVKLQVLLDRAHASPGEIDGTLGENTRKAIAAYAEMKSLGSTEQVTQEVWRALSESDSEPALVSYKITKKDTRGPFSKKIPEDFRAKAAMDRLGYTSPRELLAEKFHMSEQLLRKLNPGASFDKEGDEIVVANVEHDSLPGKVLRVKVDATRQRVEAYGEDDKLIAIYPATVGSEDRPTPKGEFKVTKISENPVYHYDPSLNFRGVHVNEKLDLPPGPNNPVGAVWIDLSAEGYGIHGTPDPDKISKSASHGCIRLTNWDALDLAKHVSKGTPVLIEQGEKTGGLEAPNQGSRELAGTEEAPLPERSPVAGGTEQTPLAPGQMTTIPWTEIQIAEAKSKCSEALASLALNYESLPPIKEGLCGAPSPILLKSVGANPEVVLEPPAIVTCALAKALNTWLSQSVQPQANSSFNSPVTKLHVGSYTCRNRNGGADAPLSEHALANAIDISDFVLASGKSIAVVDSWTSGNPPPPMPNPGRVSSSPNVKPISVSLNDPEKAFLKSVRDDACGIFGTVLGPGADEAHKSHLHLDAKQRRGASFCQ
jgi:peptidoglycan hydrolase-like protein with peptidoglycan-binding domain